VFVFSAGASTSKTVSTKLVSEPLVPVVICQLCDDVGHCARNCTYTLAESSYRFSGKLGLVPLALPVTHTHTEIPLPPLPPPPPFELINTQQI
jgi:hypothetical protein